MILNYNITFCTPVLEYLKILSLPNSKLSLSQPVIARKKPNTNLKLNLCAPQLQYITNDALIFISLAAVRVEKTALTLKCYF